MTKNFDAIGRYHSHIADAVTAYSAYSSAMNNLGGDLRRGAESPDKPVDFGRARLALEKAESDWFDATVAIKLANEAATQCEQRQVTLAGLVLARQQ